MMTKRTCKAGGNENARETTKTMYEGRTRNSPIVGANIMVLTIATNVDHDANNDEGNNCGYLKSW